MAKISAFPNGPYSLEGAELRRQSGKSLPSEKKVALCRCGGSNNKPFCDGSHWDANFRDPA